jgi:hypothetical protein
MAAAFEATVMAASISNQGSSFNGVKLKLCHQMLMILAARLIRQLSLIRIG